MRDDPRNVKPLVGVPEVGAVDVADVGDGVVVVTALGAKPVVVAPGVAAPGEVRRPRKNVAPKTRASPATMATAANQPRGDRGCGCGAVGAGGGAVSYTHLRAHEPDSYLVCRLLLE